MPASAAIFTAYSAVVVVVMAFLSSGLFAIAFKRSSALDMAYKLKSNESPQ